MDELSVVVNRTVAEQFAEIGVALAEVVAAPDQMSGDAAANHREAIRRRLYALPNA